MRAEAGNQVMSETRTIQGPVYVVGDNVDTDQIIPAKHLNLVPTIPEEYRKLGSFALSGLPEGCEPFVKEGQDVASYRIIIAGRNFGCGSSREHAPIALGAAGIAAVVAASYARIFFRNCVATGEVYPLESTASLVEAFGNGDEAILDLDSGTLKKVTSGEVFELRPIGAVAPVIEAGGIFGYARKTGMVASAD